jgi:hypothetical protein
VNAEERFEELVAEFADQPDVTVPDAGGGFGSGTLRVQGKVFAMLVRGRLVVKLPKRRVDALVDAGEGVRFDANKGRPMREWFTLDPASDLEWSSLGHEALTFVSPSQQGRQ